MGSEENPVVSVIIPMLNEEQNIEACIRSFLSGSYPKEKLEILVVDGKSIDRSCEIVRGLAKSCSQIRLVTNERVIQSSAMNIGLKMALGEYVFRADAHTIYSPEYIETGVAWLLNRQDIFGVGGVTKPFGLTSLGRAIAACWEAKFGAGNAKYRYSKEAVLDCDTVPFGAWRRKDIVKFGFREEWKVNEDYELNIRIRSSGGILLLDPRMHSAYRVRESFGKLAKQYYRYGYWRAKTVVAYPSFLRWRQMMAPLFVLGLIFSVCVSFYSVPFALVVPSIYSLANGYCSALLSTSDRALRFYHCFVCFFLMHFSYGVGFLVGSLRWLFTVKSKVLTSSLT